MTDRDPASIEHVSDTAFLVAQYRADESARPDALFHDPFAARLAGEKGRAVGEALLSARTTSWSVAIRTVVIDEMIRDAIERGIDTVVNLGAGLDARPYRLDLPADLRWIEVDYPAVIAYKSEKLHDETPRCRLERVPLDLADRQARRRFLARFETTTARVLVVSEGVILYLAEDDVASLADDLRAISRIEGWIVDYFSKALHVYRERSGVAQQMRKTPFRFQPADWLSFFARHGWRPAVMRYIPIEGARRGRRAPLPLGARLMMSLWRVFARGRRRRMARTHGYALLEPAPRELQ